MAAKLVLPILGGAPNVWNTTMVFFQITLLLGYLYAHLLTRRLQLRAQFAVHALLLATVLLALPIALPPDSRTPGSWLHPSAWLLLVLTMIAGLPYFAVATTGPLLQSWFGRTDDARAKDPYFLYAASNAGSLLGLLAFPFLIEPNFLLRGQSEIWTIGYALFAALVLACGARLMRRHSAPAPAHTTPAAPPSPTRRVLWMALATGPSALSIGATSTITMDVAAVPLLWIIPLSIYLITYILAFSRFPCSATLAGRIAILAVIAVALNHVYDTRYPLWFVIGIHLLGLAACSFACHRRLYELRPDASRLTEFYLLASLGGALGGIFAAVLAPAIFTGLFEYPIALALCLGLAAPGAKSLATRWWKHAILAFFAAAAVVLACTCLPLILPSSDFYRLSTICFGVLFFFLLLHFPGANFRIAAAVLALWSTISFSDRSASGLLLADRSFFGTYEIFRRNDETRLRHGTTMHGSQFRDAQGARVPTLYYNPRGPLGDVIGLLRSQGRPLSVAIVGLGAGTVSAYAEKGDRFVYFEIDPLVGSIASDPRLFTYITDARARGAAVDIVLTDGRLGLARTRESFDLIILDAFSSDSVPVHLLTLEALKVYKERLAPGGLIAIHISNRYFDLASMCSQIAARDEMFSTVRFDLMREPDARETRESSDWVVCSPSTDLLSKLLKLPEWFKIKVDPAGRVWTDSYSSLFDVHWK